MFSGLRFSLIVSSFIPDCIIAFSSTSVAPFSLQLSHFVFLPLWEARCFLATVVITTFKMRLLTISLYMYCKLQTGNSGQVGSHFNNSSKWVSKTNPGFCCSHCCYERASDPFQPILNKATKNCYFICLYDEVHSPKYDSIACFIHYR